MHTNLKKKKKDNNSGSGCVTTDLKHCSVLSKVNINFSNLQ